MKNAGRSGKPPENREEKAWDALRFWCLRPKLENRLPWFPKAREGLGCSSRGHGEEVLPTFFPFKEPVDYTTQLKWQRRLRHGAPRSNGPGVRRRRWASATTRHSGHFERTRQPRLRCLPLALHPFLTGFSSLHLLGFRVRIRLGWFGRRRRGCSAPPWPPLSSPLQWVAGWDPPLAQRLLGDVAQAAIIFPIVTKQRQETTAHNRKWWCRVPAPQPHSQPISQSQSIPRKGSAGGGGGRQTTRRFGKGKLLWRPPCDRPHPPPPFWIVARNLRCENCGNLRFPILKTEGRHGLTAWRHFQRVRNVILV